MNKRKRHLYRERSLRQGSRSFFTAADVLLLAFAQTDFTCNPLETGITVEHLNLILIGNGLDKFGSHNGLYDKVRRRASCRLRYGS